MCARAPCCEKHGTEQGEVQHRKCSHRRDAPKGLHTHVRSAAACVLRPLKIDDRMLEMNVRVRIVSVSSVGGITEELQRSRGSVCTDYTGCRKYPIGCTIRNHPNLETTAVHNSIRTSLRSST